MPHIRPVRPKPVCTSSQTKTMPCSSHRRRTPSMNSDGATTNPPSPCTFSRTIAAETVAALVLETVQGEGGFVVAPSEFIEGVRRLCDEHGIVFVCDEVQTGFGRTGRMWGIEHYDVEPDLITVAKSIAAGLPLSGVLGTAKIMDAPGDSAVGGTYVGNPVAQAAAMAVLDVFEEESLNDRSGAIGEQ